MNEPRRWLDPASGASDELRSLMAVGAGAAPRMPSQVRAELAARVAQLPPPVAAAPWWTRAALAVGGVSLVVGGAVATVRAHKPVTPAAHVAVARPRAPEPPRVAPVVAAPTPTPAPAPAPVDAPATLAHTEPRPAVETHEDDREERRLEEARRVLERDPAAALAITRSLARTHRRSVFEEERDYLSMRALVALGRTDEARHAGERFLARHPAGLYSAAVRRQMERLP